jgi:hypothetical protein
VAIQSVNPLNAELNPICHLLALLGGATIVVVCRLRVKKVSECMNNLYLPQTNLTIYQKGAYYLGIKFFNNLPFEIKNFAGNQKKV